MKLDKLDCSILVEEKPLIEYDDSDANTPRNLKAKKLTKYVEAREGTLFTIKIWVKSNFNFKDADELCAEVHIDGKIRDVDTISKEDHAERGATILQIDAFVVNTADGWQEMKFRFGEIATREIAKTDNITALKRKHKDLGTIKVVIWRAENAKAFDDEDPPAENLVREPIARKVLKGDAKSLQTVFEPGRKVAPPKSDNDMDYLDNHPIATFVFKPRTLEALNQLHVIPQTPPPVPLCERQVESLSDAEKTQLIGILKSNAEATHVRIKQERQERTLEALQSLKRARIGENEDEDDDEVEIVAERPAKRRGPEEGDTVLDLSD